MTEKEIQSLYNLLEKFRYAVEKESLPSPCEDIEKTKLLIETFLEMLGQQLEYFDMINENTNE